jgi:predicted O-linked N-acetylglucosamine transferase (SPINDLY family)
VGVNLVPLFRNHDHAAFEIICYSQTARPDSMTQWFQRHADLWRDIAMLSDTELCSQIRRDQVDILVDLSLHTSENRLLVFARKPAPVQVSFAGYPGTTGLTAIDYRLSDPYLDPPGLDESIFSEKTVRLPNSFWCYDPNDGSNLPVGELPAIKSGIITFGCLNNFCKINTTTLNIWSQVLRHVAGSKLLLLAKEGTHQERLRNYLNDRGIAPDRVEFIPYMPRIEYLRQYHRIDIGLDTFPYNGHTTSLDSHWMGVPVVTLVGATTVSRAGWCQLSNLGLTALAGHSSERFARAAIDLANDRQKLVALRSTLRHRMEQSPLMDSAGFTRGIESSYREMWQKWCGS